MKLKELCSFYTGTGFPKEYQGLNAGDYPFYKVSDVSDTISRNSILIDEAHNYINESILNVIKGKLLPKNTVIFAKIGEALKLNRRAITTKVSVIDNNLMGIKPNEKLIDLYYFYYFMKRIDLVHYSESTTLPSVRKSSIENIEIKLLPLWEQRKKSSLILRLESIIAKKKDLMNSLDELIKSRFIELFGDPNNPYNVLWPIVPISKVTDCMVPGRDKPKSFTGTIPWITIDDLIVNNTTEKSKNNIGLTVDEIKSVKRKCIPSGSIIMSCVGNLGLCSISACELVINQQLHSFQCKSMVDNFYLMYYLSFLKGYMNKMATNTTVLYMNKTVCNSIPVILPPIELQHKFSKFLNKINKLKSDVQKSIDETQLLMDSLMQEYFG